MKETVSESCSAEEIEWWDEWNSRHRTSSFEDESAPARTGALAVNEVRNLALDGPGILEIGCGTGWVARELSDEWGHYIGLDLSPAAIDAAKERVPGGIFEAVDFLAWNASGRTFDVILIIDTIAYFRNQEESMRKVQRLLRPGGFVVLTTVNPYVYSRMSWIGEPGKHQARNWLSRKALHGLLSECGLRVVKSRTVFPAGDRGILRFLNAPKLERALAVAGLSPFWRAVREFFQLGQYRIVVAAKEN